MRRLLLAGLLLAGGLSTGCYYSHLASGQLDLIWSRRPLEDVLDDKAIPARTRTLLVVVPLVRAYASALGLEVGDQYTSFVDWPGDRIVTTLVRTRPRSIEPIGFWFPFVGRLPYKGYFDRERAERDALRLREDDAYDVCVSGVAAYSTLGWLDDPVTSPMLRRGAATLVETLLHELVHATAFVSEDVDFNESVAQFIGQEAAVRFFAERGATLPEIADPTSEAGRARSGSATRSSTDARSLGSRSRCENACSSWIPKATGRRSGIGTSGTLGTSSAPWHCGSSTRPGSPSERVCRMPVSRCAGPTFATCLVMRTSSQLSAAISRR